MSARRWPRLAVVAFALAACDRPKTAGSESATLPANARVQAAASTYTTLTGHLTYRVPAAWSSSVRIIEEPGESVSGTWPGVQHAVHFVYQPTGSGARPQPVLSLLVYDEAKLPKNAAGEEVARANGRVYRAIVTSRNGYAAGADHDRFASLIPTMDAVKGAIAPT